MLAKLVSPAFPVDGVTALVAMLPFMLDVSDALFTPATMAHVARAPRRQSVPALSEIMDALDDYRRTYLHRPVLALPAPRQEGRPPPDEVERGNVRGAIEGLFRDLAAARVEREGAQPGPVLRPLPDVTAKGEALARIRAAGGVVAKAGAAPDAAAEGRPRDDRLADAARRRPASRAGRRAGA